MIYNTKIEAEKNKLLERIDSAIKNEQKVEMKIPRNLRTINQNSYLHLILAYFGMETGYTALEAKEVWKRDFCPEIFEYEKNGLVFYKSSKDLNTLEMTNAINKLKNKAAMIGVILPDAEDLNFLQWIKEESERYGQSEYL